jgi:glycosyltransferase involved in cell wall biosynthesis
MSDAKEELRKGERNLLVSIIVVSRNAKDTIRRCLDSIINQTYPNTEIIVVDSSDDGTEKIIEEYAENSKFPFKIIRQEPKGVGAARSEGLRNASGDIITGVDTDCYIPSDFIEKIAKSFNSEKVMGVCAKHIVKSSSNTLFSKLLMLYEDVMLKKNKKVYDVADVGILAMRREFYEAVGTFDENLAVGEDSVFWKMLWKTQKRFEKKGFLFPLVDVSLIEEKQAQTFKDYWKKCMWYGKALANVKYLKSDLRNILRLFGSFYLFILPFIAIPAFVIWVGFGILLLVPLFATIVYMTYQAFMKRIFTWRVLLLPAILYYKGFWSFLGFIKEFFKGD